MLVKPEGSVFAVLTVLAGILSVLPVLPMLALIQKSDDYQNSV